jgi:hypothetical protein
MTRPEAERAIAQLLARGFDDEVRVLGVIAQRIGNGYSAYGPLRLERDRRDFGAELVAELLDGCVYGACEMLRRNVEAEQYERPPKEGD